MNKPLVSVIIPTFNREALLPRAIDSVIAQSVPDWEIVLVDDGSTDGTEPLAKRLAETLGERFQYHAQSNLGCSAARNRGIDASRGRFVTFLDSDDEFTPDRLARQLALFEARPRLGLVYCDFGIVTTHGTGERSAFDRYCSAARNVSCTPVLPGMFECDESVFDTLLQAYFIATITGMVRREVLGDSIRFAEGLAYSEEWLFYLQLCRTCRVGFVDEPLAIHHHTTGSLARTNPLRNTERYHALLRTIGQTIPDLNRRQRRVLRNHLARSALQLGYEAQRAGLWCKALGSFARSLGYAPSTRAARGGISSLWQGITASVSAQSASRLSAQEAPRGVR